MTDSSPRPSRTRRLRSVVGFERDELGISPSQQSEAVEELFEQEYDSMVRLAYVLTGSRPDAEDVVQDAFIEVQKRWKRLLNPGGYLRTAVVNGARNQQSRTTNRHRILRTNSTKLVMSDESGLDGPDYLLDVLDSLPERHRVAVILAYFGDLGPCEIAEVLGCRPGTAKSLVHRGLKRMRKELGDV